MKYLGLFPDVPDLQGCSDGGCVFRPPTGMHTNGGCACMKRGADPLLLQLNLRRVSKHMESMRAERDALAKDAARYRWLKSVYFTPGKSAFALVGPTRSASELDATIDAAMAEEARTRKQS